MEPLLLGLGAPSIAGAVGRVVTPVAKLLATPFASLLQDEIQADSPVETQAIELKDLQTRAAALQADLESRIQRAVEESGLRLDSPIRLRLSEFDGTLEAEGLASPDREILEAALASDTRLADDFRQLAAARKLFSAAETHEEFSEAYSRDPYQAIADFVSETDDRFEALLHLSESDSQLRLEFE